MIVSDLTRIECDRAILPLAQQWPDRRAHTGILRVRLAEVAAGWAIEPIVERVVDRARGTFPDDAIRSLDAIHLATAIVARDAIGGVDVLSLDVRIRASAAALGFRVVPD